MNKLLYRRQGFLGTTRVRHTTNSLAHVKFGAERSIHSLRGLNDLTDILPAASNNEAIIKHRISMDVAASLGDSIMANPRVKVTKEASNGAPLGDAPDAVTAL